MRSLKRMIAVAMLAVFATLGAQTAMANDGILVSDSHRDGILVTDSHRDGILVSDIQAGNTTSTVTMWDIIGTVLNMANGVLLSD